MSTECCLIWHRSPLLQSSGSNNWFFLKRRTIWFDWKSDSSFLFVVNDKINCPMSFRAKRGIFERFFVTSFLRMTKGNFQWRLLSLLTAHFVKGCICKSKTFKISYQCLWVFYDMILKSQAKTVPNLYIISGIVLACFFGEKSIKW